MQLTKQLLNSLLSAEGFSKEAFEKIHNSGEQVISIRLNPAKMSFANCLLPIEQKIPWTEFGYYLKERPSFTFDPLFHAGCYYVQEASSMFLEQAIKQTFDLSKPIKVLDLCAAPGGKSTHIHSLISKESLLVSNETIRSRANILKDNIIKWGCENVVVTNNDPRDFAKLESYFDLIVVDAPCSGSGLFRKDPDAIKEWSENIVQLCSQRQQRILADVWPALKKDGILIYSTCSYSKEEDEEIVEWLNRNLSIANFQLSVDKNWGIVESGGGYRFWPDKLKGEGFFITCIQKKEGEIDSTYMKKSKLEFANKSETEIIERWIKKEGSSFVKHNNTVYAWPEIHVSDFRYLLNQMRVIYSGILIGELMRDKLVPAHELAMSNIVSDSIARMELSYEQSVKYLQRKDMSISSANKGWQLATNQGHILGWVNVLASRINNYYPKELRILKDI